MMNNLESRKMSSDIFRKQLLLPLILERFIILFWSSKLLGLVIDFIPFTCLSINKFSWSGLKHLPERSITGCSGRGEIACPTCNVDQQPGFYKENQMISCSVCHGRGLIAHSDGSDTLCVPSFCSAFSNSI